MTRDTSSSHEYLLYPEPDDEPGEPDTQASETKAPHLTLGRHLLEAAMTPAQLRRFRHSPGLCVLIEAPTPAWVVPLRSAALMMASWQHAEARDGIKRSSQKASEGEEHLALTLGAGHRVVAVSHAPERTLPPSLVSGADMRIRTGPPTPEVIRKAIRDATGKNPRVASEKLGARLDYFDLVSAIRIGSNIRTCLRRLEAATVGRSAVDGFLVEAADLADLHGYGQAGEFARRLVQDVESWRRGEIPDLSSVETRVVLAGPPGTGKTTLVAAIAKATDLHLISTSVARWFIDGNSYLDGVLKQAEAVFGRASAAAPAILFLDEIDAIPNRATVGSRNADYWAPIVGYILQFLDGNTQGGPSSANLIVIGATNFGDALDPALVRPGRLSRVINILPPDEGAIPGILRQHLGKDLEGVDLGDFAGIAVGATGAVIAGWAKAAKRRARVAGRPMELNDLRAEILSPETRSPGSLWRCAVHEAAHATVAYAIGAGVLRSVSILSHGGYGGRMVIAGKSGEITRTRADIEALIVTALAGRAGEIAFGLEASTGAHEDLAMATGLAASIHASYGLGEELTHRRPADRAASLLDADPAFKSLVEASLRGLAACATGIVTRHRALVEMVANALVENSRIDAVGFRRIVDAYELDNGPCNAGHDGVTCHG